MRQRAQGGRSFLAALKRGVARNRSPASCPQRVGPPSLPAPDATAATGPVPSVRLSVPPGAPRPLLLAFCLSVCAFKRFVTFMETFVRIWNEAVRILRTR